MPSKGIRLPVPRILLNPYGRRRLIVGGLSAAAAIALAVAGLVVLRSHSELFAAGSGSVRSVVAKLKGLIHSNDATTNSQPRQAAPAAQISRLRSRHHQNPAAKRALPPELAEEIKSTEAMQGDEFIDPGTEPLQFSSEAQVSNQLPAIVIWQFPRSSNMARLDIGRSATPPAPSNSADSRNLFPAVAARKFVPEQISGSLPERSVLSPTPVGVQQGEQEGSVVARVRIGRDGSVRSVRLVSGDPLLATAVVGAVSQWRYRPWTDGPGETERQVTVTFTISAK
jgi:TonB family protein